jgi:L-serine dehydratase
VVFAFFIYLLKNVRIQTKMSMKSINENAFHRDREEGLRMTNLPGLVHLGELIRGFEPQVNGAVFTILTHENREEIARYFTDGLVGSDNAHKVKIEISSGEYVNKIAVLQIGENKYTFSKDHNDLYISEINYYTCRITADANGLLVYHTDYPGVVHEVSRVLAENRINIFSLNVSREQKGKSALLVSLTDESIPGGVVTNIKELPQVEQVLVLR